MTKTEERGGCGPPRLSFGQQWAKVRTNVICTFDPKTRNKETQDLDEWYNMTVKEGHFPATGSEAKFMPVMRALIQVVHRKLLQARQDKEKGHMFVRRKLRKKEDELASKLVKYNVIQMAALSALGSQTKATHAKTAEAKPLVKPSPSPSAPPPPNPHTSQPPHYMSLHQQYPPGPHPNPPPYPPPTPSPVPTPQDSDYTNEVMAPLFQVLGGTLEL